MPSPDNLRLHAWRVWAERVAHGVALAIMLWLLWEAVRPKPVGNAQVVRVGELPAALARWSTIAPPSRVYVRADSALAPGDRDWLAALAQSGAQVAWGSAGIVPVAVAAEPLADPLGATRVWAAAPSGDSVMLGDDFGDLDAALATSGGARFLAHSAPDEVRARVSKSEARSAIRDSLTFKRLLVLGTAGWEVKFVVAALEERGWEVDARFIVGRKGDVIQGPGSPIDTTRYSAVIAMDTAAAPRAAELVAYVRSGGGLVLTPSAATLGAFAPLRAGTPGRELAAVEPFDRDAPEPRRSLALTPIALREDAFAVERRDAQVAVAARRVGRGRVTVVGYDDMWRWRLAGSEDALDGHNAWWASVVAGVAHVGRLPRAGSPLAVDEAPYARLVDRLGPESVVPANARYGAPSHTLLLAVFGIALLLEFLSRRLRGSP